MLAHNDDVSLYETWAVFFGLHGQANAKPKLYNPGQTKRTLLYQTIADHFELGMNLPAQASSIATHRSPNQAGQKGGGVVVLAALSQYVACFAA